MFDKIKNGYAVNCLARKYVDGELSTSSDARITYLLGEDVSFYSFAYLSFDGDTPVVGKETRYYADESGEKAGYVYQEKLSPENAIEKDYSFDENGKPYKFRDAFSSFFDCVNTGFLVKDATGAFVFDDEDDEREFLSQFLTSVSYLGVSKFIVDEEGNFQRFVYETSDVYIAIEIVSKASEIIVPHISPLEEDTGSKTSLANAISALGNNYTVKHQSPAGKSFVYYDGASISLDQDESGVDSMDEIYLKNSDNEYMSRLVYGSDSISSFDYWAEDHYSTMHYYGDKTYEDLSVRLSQINLGLFKKTNFTTYTTIDGAAPVVFAYCMPAMNVRQLYVDNAKSISISISNGVVSQIKLAYSTSSYSSGVTKTDTLTFSEVGTTSMPSDFVDTLNINKDIPLPEALVGSFEGSDSSGAHQVSITLAGNRTGVYSIDGKNYEIAMVYTHTTDTRIDFGFDYDDEGVKRYVSANLDLETSAISGHDGNHGDVMDYMNISLTKAAQ